MELGDASQPFDTVIACVDARSADWVGDIPWAALLGPAGAVAFITHARTANTCDSVIRDCLAPVAQSAHLIRLDQITLHAVPAQPHATVSFFIRPLPAVGSPNREWP
ncbi:hypothetical protein [Streptomyces sp. AN091965]|uniref:hypothetical protein n=1 Tax=Streptomyces sp. AN091965 TaxID=2927803 RepID=UPI001F624D7A|nr:hypothetical protein [Streptomyces sp. AN091965]MCI3928798.1 hypothetical protein [Streptomyces sp. AN091965]